MRTVFILVLFLCTTNSVADEMTTTVSPMSCTMDGTITYKGIPSGVQSVASTCGTAKLNSSSDDIVITGCDVGTAVGVNLYNTTSASPKPVTPTSATHSVVLDGDVALILTCTVVDEKKAYSVKVQVPGSINATAFTSKEQNSLKMSLTYHGNQTTPSAVELGQTYDLHVSGGGTHVLKIKTCKAAGTNEMTGAVLVYDSSSQSDSIGLISPGADGNSGQLTATLKGFRLVTSSAVFLQCDIYVCNSTTCLPGGKRKRTKPKLKTATVRFEVMSKRSAQAVNGARDMNSAGKNMMTLVLVIVASYLSF